MRQKMKHLTGILLSLVMVIGLMSGMSTTAQADEVIPDTGIEFPAAVYITGPFNNWTTGSAEYAMKIDGKVCSIILKDMVAGDHVFKICGATWDEFDYGADGTVDSSSAIKIELEKYNDALYKGANIQFTLAEKSDVKIIFDGSTSKPKYMVTLVDSALEAVKEKINGIKAGDTESIKAAREAYEALTPEQKAKVEADLLTKLTDAEKSIVVNNPTNTVTEPENNSAKGEVVDNKQKTTSISKVKAGKKCMTVTWKKQTKGGITGYEIQYSTDKKDVKTATIKKAKIASNKIKKLKSKKKYFVRIRTIKSSKDGKVYSKWSKTKSVKVK